MMKPIRIDAKFKPNYKNSCICCGRTPTVDVYVLDKLAESTGMCGVCIWGKADCINQMREVLWKLAKDHKAIPVLAEPHQAMGDAIDTHLLEHEAAKGEPVAWRYRLDGDMQWQHTADKRICMGEVQPLYISPMLASARVPDDEWLKLAQELEVYKAVAPSPIGPLHAAGMALAYQNVAKTIRAMLAAAPKREEG